jgi:hypothetical protein
MSNRDTISINEFEFERVEPHKESTWNRVVTFWLDFKRRKKNPTVFFISLDEKGYMNYHYISGEDYDWVELRGIQEVRASGDGIGAWDYDPRFIVEYKQTQVYDEEIMWFKRKWIVIISERKREIQ